MTKINNVKSLLNRIGALSTRALRILWANSSRENLYRLGRMGQELTKQILVDKNFLFVGGYEYKSHPKIGKKLKIDTNAKQLLYKR